MAPLWSSQPFKAIYTVFCLLKAPPLLALLALRCLVRPLRPVPQWSVAGHVAGAATRFFFRYITATRSQRTLYRDPAEANERCARAGPPPAGLFSGALAASDTVKPAPVDAVWFPDAAPRDGAAQRVVIHFPGGGFVMAFGHTTTGREVAGLMARHMRAGRTVWAQYRLAGTPGTGFPAALQDALTFYHYVLSLGVDPNDIVLSGDSAGGNVAIALLRYLEGLQGRAQSLPLPAGAIVFSPWVHVSGHAARDYDQSSNSAVDVLVGSFLQWGADTYRPDGELSEELQAYISPLHHPFETAVPLFLHAGAAEGFCGDIKEFADEMKQANGDRVRFSETAFAPHDILISHEPYGLTGELCGVIEDAYDSFEAARQEM